MQIILYVCKRGSLRGASVGQSVSACQVFTWLIVCVFLCMHTYIFVCLCLQSSHASCCFLLSCGSSFVFCLAAGFCLGAALPVAAHWAQLETSRAFLIVFPRRAAGLLFRGDFCLTGQPLLCRDYIKRGVWWIFPSLSNSWEIKVKVWEFGCTMCWLVFEWGNMIHRVGFTVYFSQHGKCEPENLQTSGILTLWFHRGRWWARKYKHFIFFIQFSTWF